VLLHPHPVARAQVVGNSAINIPTAYNNATVQHSTDRCRVAQGPTTIIQYTVLYSAVLVNKGVGVGGAVSGAAVSSIIKGECKGVKG
jgi:hypothetical protein